MPVKTRCPRCGKESQWEGNKWRPFCSERCKMADLGAWISEGYRIPGASEEDAGPENGRNHDDEDR